MSEPTGGTDAAGYRPLLFSIAYGMTGSVGDAEDIVQDAFVGLTRARRAGTVVHDLKAYLTTAVTRLGINHLRSARVRRETYVGDWLPEPVVVPAGSPGPARPPEPAERAELADALSMALLVLLEDLSPVQRAVFVLREVFEYGYPDIAAIVGRSEPNCRQILARARRCVAAARRPEDVRPDRERRAQGEELARRFFAAAEGGDIDALLGVLAPDVTIRGDGGGKAYALARSSTGALRVARTLRGGFRRTRTLGASFHPAAVNGRPGAVLHDARGRVAAVIALDIADGAIRSILAVSNPDKLTHLGPLSNMATRPN